MAINYHFPNSKILPKNEKFPKDIILRAHRNGWMNADLMESRIKDVWKRRPGALRNPFSVSVLDTFRERLSEEMKVTFGRLWFVVAWPASFDH
jgi:hypothetical protein